MSIFDGKIRRHDTPRARLTGQTPRLRVTITAAGDTPRATIAKAGGFGGTWVRVSKIFAAGFARLSIFYRFAYALSHISTWHQAKPTTAPAQTTKAERSVQTDTETTPYTVPGAEAVASRGVRIGKTAVAEVCPGTAGTAKKNIVLGRCAVADAVKRAVGRADKVIVFERMSKAETAPAVETAASDEFLTVYEAIAATADTETSVTDSWIHEPVAEAPAVAAPAQIAAVESVEKIGHTARAAVWFFPEFVGGTLTVYQVFSGVQSGDALEIDTEAESTYWANAKVTDGVLHLVFTETTTQTGNILEVG